MADPNQTPKQGKWSCPCNGCQRAEQREREQLIYFLDYMKENDNNQEFYDMVIEMIKARMPKPKKKK